MSAAPDFAATTLRPRDLLRVICVASIILAVGVNLYEFDQVNNRLGKNLRAVYHAPIGGNIFDIGTDYRRSVTDRAAPFYYFGLMHPQATVILPSFRLKSWFELDLGIMSFGRAHKIVLKDYDARAELRVRFRRYRVDLSEFVPIGLDALRALNGRLLIYRRSPAARNFIVFAPEGDPRRRKPIMFVDVDLFD